MENQVEHFKSEAKLNEILKLLDGQLKNHEIALDKRLADNKAYFEAINILLLTPPPELPLEKSSIKRQIMQKVKIMNISHKFI